MHIILAVADICVQEIGYGLKEFTLQKRELLLSFLGILSFATSVRGKNHLKLSTLFKCSALLSEIGILNAHSF